MSQKWGSYSDLELEIAFDNGLEAERLKSLVVEDEIERISQVVNYSDLDQSVKQDFCNRLESIVEKHQAGIEKDTRDYIDNKFKHLKSTDYAVARSSIELDSGVILIEHYADGEEYTEAILSEIENYDLKGESDSFKAFVFDLGKLLNEYGFVVEDYEVNYKYMTRECY